ncbi:unnamed protein product [Mytilus edulis]|uniref:Uncharacterized protein n=1 Tax=Mytilus edulis TaxID=6550 RepID=A0A8S3UFN0_MYTED|nr:unnamed protein product [Mytilus edulis]
MARYRTLKGSSYIPLPIKLRSKHAIINVKNKDSKCFMWSILAELYPAKRDAERVWKYKEHTSSLKFDTIMFPVKLADIPKFEKQNEISINVFGFNKGEVFPIHISKHRFEQHVNLLMISDSKNHISAGLMISIDYWGTSIAIAHDIFTVHTAYTDLPKKNF